MANWLLAAVCGVLITALCGGTCFVLIGLLVLSSYRRLAKLVIPGDDGNLELDVAQSFNLEKAELGDGLRRI